MPQEPLSHGCPPAGLLAKRGDGTTSSVAEAQTRTSSTSQWDLHPWWRLWCAPGVCPSPSLWPPVRSRPPSTARVVNNGPATWPGPPPVARRPRPHRDGTGVHETRSKASVRGHQQHMGAVARVRVVPSRNLTAARGTCAATQRPKSIARCFQMLIPSFCVTPTAVVARPPCATNPAPYDLQGGVPAR